MVMNADAMLLRDFLHHNGMMLLPMNNENNVPVEMFTLFMTCHLLF